MTEYTPKDHTFVICAYGENPFLEESILSVMHQTLKTNAKISTSTPNDYIRNLAEKYRLPMMVNQGKGDMADNFNFAVHNGGTKLVTLIHQDDVYLPEYAEEMLRRVNRAKNPILFSSDYGELRGTEQVFSNRLLNIKKVLRLPMRLLPGTLPGKRLSLAFGDSICCPSVTYFPEKMGTLEFRSGMKTNLDWELWEKLSRIPGSFAYSPKPLMLHRIHEGSETSHTIEETGRSGEDLEMFRKFHTEPAAKILTRLYSGSEKSNRL